MKLRFSQEGAFRGVWFLVEWLVVCDTAGVGSPALKCRSQKS